MELLLFSRIYGYNSRQEIKSSKQFLLATLLHLEVPIILTKSQDAAWKMFLSCSNPVGQSAP